MIKNRFAVVAVARDVIKSFHYAVPERLSDIIAEGMRVLVPFGKNRIEGYVTGFTDKSDVKDVKDIISLIDDAPVLSSEMLNLAKWIAEYYLSSLGMVIKMMLPAGFGVSEQRYLRIISNPDNLSAAPLQEQIVNLIKEKKEVRLDALIKKLNKQGVYSAIDALKQKGIIEEFFKEIKKNNLKKEIYYKARDLSVGNEKDIKSIIQQNALKLITEKGEAPLSELKLRGVSLSALQTLYKNGLIERIEKEVTRDPFSILDIPQEQAAPVLSDAQDAALKNISGGIESGRFAPYLLHGVTGSGKTEVYLRAISLIKERGKGTIVLVPEIALTPQLVMRFKARFRDKIAVLHSRLSPAERLDAWRRIKNGDVDIAIGARSAIFAPFKNLGLIIVDEEHDQLYKQEDGVRYNARDMALVRGKFNNAVVILGSATPAIETYHNAKTGKYNYLTLPERIDKRPMPEAVVVDLKKDKTALFSEKLINAIKDRLTKKEQTILFLNRRGFAPVLLCRDCGFNLQCPNCSIALTYHKSDEIMKCHYCDFEIAPPDNCPQCKGSKMRFIGLGTQRIEEDVRRFFTEARIARMDRDTTGKKMAHYEIVKGVIDEDIDILIGTQMVAKGHDFPKVTLVGVLLAEAGLFYPDFRSAERTFQIITQVSGRAGRGNLRGNVILQTYNPEHYSISYAINHDYEGFFDKELSFRKELNYPPFARITSVLLKGNDPKKVEKTIQEFSLILKQVIKGKGMELLGPVPAPVSRIRGKHRWILLIKAKEISLIRKSLIASFEKLKTKTSLSGIDIEIDIDPQ
ncbi:MAG: primosomal protein N' [Nitrospirota bacterium]